MSPKASRPVHTHGCASTTSVYTAVRAQPPEGAAPPAPGLEWAAPGLCLEPQPACASAALGSRGGLGGKAFLLLGILAPFSPPAPYRHDPAEIPLPNLEPPPVVQLKPC